VPQYDAPGVYTEEKTTSTITIQEASSDVGAMSGVAAKGPVNSPVRLSSHDQFLKVYGGYIPGSSLAHGSRQFFTNGGTVLWVNRVIGAGASESTLTLNNSGPTATVVVNAFSPGSHGQELSVMVTRKDTVVATLTANVPSSAVTEIVVNDVRQLYVGATFNVANTNNLRAVVTRIDAGAKKVFFASRAPTGAITAAGSVLTLEEWTITVLRNGSTVEGIPSSGAMAHSVLAGSRYFRNVINNNDPLREIKVTDSLLAESNTVDPRPVTQTVPATLTGGADGSAVTDLEQIGAAGNSPTGLYTFDSNSEASMIAIPGVTTVTVHQGLLAYAEGRKKTPMMAILALPSGQTAAAAVTYKNTTAMLYSDKGAVYAPWIKEIDPVSNVLSLFSPEGAVMGVYARTSRSRGVQRAPAGTAAAQLTAVQDVERIYSDPDLGLLNTQLINAICAVAGRGIVIMGARTLANGDFRYVNVRRVFNAIRTALQKSFDDIVFESNDETTRAKVERSVNSFLLTQWRAKVLKGDSATSAFFVKCDESNNPPSVQKAGQLVCDIGLAVADPAEFLVFTLQRDQRAADAELAAAGL
jgi:uncharacterized protein